MYLHFLFFASIIPTPTEATPISKPKIFPLLIVFPSSLILSNPLHFTLLKTKKQAPLSACQLLNYQIIPQTKGQFHVQLILVNLNRERC